MSTTIQEARFDGRIAALLRDSDLPTEDLSATAAVLLFSCTANDELRGIVGLELHGSCGLLRSLAVTPEHRGEGVGEALLAHAERFAAASGVTELYLLTTTAGRYFSRHGYAMADRATAPAAIARTRQFSDLCPSSSVFMVKRDVNRGHMQ